MHYVCLECRHFAMYDIPIFSTSHTILSLSVYVFLAHSFYFVRDSISTVRPFRLDLWQKKLRFATENVCKCASPPPNDYMIESLYLSTKVIISAASTLYFKLSTYCYFFSSLWNPHIMCAIESGLFWLRNVMHCICIACALFKELASKFNETAHTHTHTKTRETSTTLLLVITRPPTIRPKLSPHHKCRSKRARDENNSFIFIENAPFRVNIC